MVPDPWKCAKALQWSERIPVSIDISSRHLLLPREHHRERRKDERQRERGVMFTRSAGGGRWVVHARSALLEGGVGS